MELYKYSDRIYYSSYEEERDRPAIGYIRGDRYSIAIDAGHSGDHLKEFYDLLKENNLPLPALTIITHWHWDHSFAMHKISGLSIANKTTNDHLLDFIRQRSPENDQKFLALDPSIAKEYANDKEIIVIPADIVFEDHLLLDAGGISVEAFEAISPHTDDATLIRVPQEKVLFFGDAISGVFPTWIPDPKLLKQMIETIEKEDADTFIGGHWPPFTKKALLDQLYTTLKEYS